MATFTSTYIDADGRTVSYEVPGLGASEMARLAVEFLDDDRDTVEDFGAWCDTRARLNRFATFCVTETLDMETGTCDPRVGFSRLYERFLASENA